MTELDYACMMLSIAIHNQKAVERKIFRESEAEKKASELWLEMSKKSTRTSKKGDVVKATYHYTKNGNRYLDDLESV